MRENSEPLKWHIFTLEDAYRERPPTQYLVDGWLALPSLNIFYGAPASYKSFICADLAASIVCGGDWLPGSGEGKAGIKTKKGPVLWIDMDNGKNRTHERVESVSRARGLNVDHPFYYISMPHPPFRADSWESFEMLMESALEVKEMCGESPKLIVIDNLGLIAGDVDENTAGMAQIMGNLRHACELIGCAIIVIHHQRKGGSQGGRSGDALRGSSTIEAAIDLAIYVFREKDSQECELSSTKTRGVPVDKVFCHLYYEHRSETKDLSKAWFAGSRPLSGPNPIYSSVMKCLQRGEMTHSKLISDVYDDLRGEVSRSKIRAYVDDMANVSGDIVYQKGLKNATIVSIHHE